MIDAMGFKVTKVRVTSLVGNIYHARIHLASGAQQETGGTSSASQHVVEFDVDARPSDAINMAARYEAPIYVNKEVAAKMAHPGKESESSPSGTGSASTQQVQEQTAAQKIIQSCKEAILQYNDPTIMYKLQLQLAIAEERFEDASQLRDIIDKMLASDRALSLVVAIETAIDDQRYEEAAKLRDQFIHLRSQNRSNGAIDAQ